MNAIERRLARIETHLSGRGDNLLELLLQALEAHGRDAVAARFERAAGVQCSVVTFPQFLHWACPNDGALELLRHLVTDADIQAARECRG